jgi:hypothetical protein
MVIMLFAPSIMVRPESDLYYMRMSAFTYLWPIMEF